MTDDLQPEPADSHPEPKPKAPRKARTAKPRAKRLAGDKPKAAAEKAEKDKAEKVKAEKNRAEKSKAEKSKAEKPKTAPKKRKPKAEAESAAASVPVPDPASIAPASAYALIEDPLGDTTDGEGRFATEAIPGSEAEAEIAAFRAETSGETEDNGPPQATASGESEEEAAEDEEPEEEEPAAPLPEPKLERLQKILSQAGIASRRRAEEMIVEGRVVVNGQVVNVLGSKADPARDHIRVDGKLLHGAKRHRYFVLNKPKGYVTTVSDPEGRPTVMEFFSKLNERLYPVGRLDYQSEGLLLMTNDGELANGLTRAASGVEKTYLVKVAGQPTEEELETLRGGVAIETDKPGSPKVRTAPARVRHVRHGDNPWYEVVLIEGRNRELRKMFSAVGHFVEKIRRVGYGPLILDLEPGHSRELDAEEVAALRLASEGKLKPRRPKSSSMLPREAGRPAEQRPGRRSGDRHSGDRPSGKSFDRGAKPFQPGRAAPTKSEWKPRREPFGGVQANRGPGRSDRPPQQSKPRFERPAYSDRPRREPDQSRPPRDRGESRFERPAFRPASSDRPRREPGQFRPRSDREGSRFEQPRRMPFSPGGERSDFARPEPQGGKFNKRPDSGRGKLPGKSFGGPAKSWSPRPDSRPYRSEGASQPFREKPRRESGPAREERPTGRPKRSFGSKPGGFPPKKSSGFSRPAGKKTPGSGPNRGPFRSGGNRPGGGKRG
ncbi:MAG: pseudouridine synthase [Terracidiphilus sp.]